MDLFFSCLIMHKKLAFVCGFGLYDHMVIFLQYLIKYVRVMKKMKCIFKPFLNGV
jgi:hypothetical protein